MRKQIHPLRVCLLCVILLSVIGMSAVPVIAQDTQTQATGDDAVNDVIHHIQGDETSITPAPPATQIITGTSGNTAQAPALPPAQPQGIPGIVAEGDNATLPQVPLPPPTYEDHKTVILRALDKVTARTKTLEIPAGQQFNFGALTIAVRACRARPPMEPADAAAFLQIVEQKPGEPMIPRFSGWMFASKPSLSALEHPVYDVWVVGCGGDKIGADNADNNKDPKSSDAAVDAKPDTIKTDKDKKVTPDITNKADKKI